MAVFLRDESLRNITVTENCLRELDAAFSVALASMPETVEERGSGTGKISALYLYVIRFDRKGFRVFSLTDLIRYFSDAKQVERLLFVVEAHTAHVTNRNYGSFVEVRLDANDPNASWIQVSSDDQTWVDSVISSIKEVLTRHKNHNGLARNQFAGLVIQIMGVVSVLLLSLWVSMRVSPYLQLENAFFLSFVFALLLLSNFWTAANAMLIGSVHALFPSIRFYRPAQDKLSWLKQAVIGGSVLLLLGYALNSAFSWLGNFLSSLIKPAS